MLLDLGEQASWTIPDRLPLRLVRCLDCELLQLAHTVDRDRLFRRYYYQSSMNTWMTDYLTNLAWYLSGRVPLPPGSVVVDIGANDGTLLGAFPNYLMRIAFEPSRTLGSNGIPWVSDFFSAKSYWKVCDRPASLVTSIAMFYDVDDPVAFGREVSEILDDDGVWVVEVQNMEPLLRSGVFDTICHEHLCYYRVETLLDTIIQAGLSITCVQCTEANGGSVRVFARRGGMNLAPLSPSEDEDEAVYQAYPGEVQREIARLQALLQPYCQTGRLYGYGASTKGNVLLQACGFGPKDIVAIADRDPTKWGMVTPGSAIPICSEAQMRAAKPDALLVLPWAFAPYFRARETELLQSGTRFIVPFEETSHARETSTSDETEHRGTRTTDLAGGRALGGGDSGACCRIDVDWVARGGCGLDEG